MAIVNAPAVTLNATGEAALLYYMGNQTTGVAKVLTAPVLIGDTVLSVNSVGGINVGATILIGTEHLSVTAKDAGASTLTVTRGVNGTTAAAYDSGAQVIELLYRDFNRLAKAGIINMLKGIVADYPPLSAPIATAQAEKDAAIAAAQAAKTAAVDGAVQ